jgi:hypothetical protein
MVAIANLIRELPEGYEDICFESGAIVRKRGITSPGDLMMLSLFHLLNGCSLVEVSEIARLADLGAVSDVAFMKRFENCSAWFMHINEMLAGGAVCDYQMPEWLCGHKVIAVDASDVIEKGRSGRLYRLHFALDIFKMKSLQYKITTQATGESLTNFSVTKGDLFIADRIYCTLNGIAHCLGGGADFIFRMKKNCFRLFDESDEVMDVLEILRGAGGVGTVDIGAFMADKDGGRIPVRMCAIKKTEEAIFKTQKRIRRAESKYQEKLSDGAKEMNEYIVVLTSLGDDIPAKDVLDLYRCRWQVECCFKRMKSIMAFGELPKRRQGSVMAWLNGKLMVALLIEKMLGGVDFSPSEANSCQQEPMA